MAWKRGDGAQGGLAASSGGRVRPARREIWLVAAHFNPLTDNWIAQLKPTCLPTCLPAYLLARLAER